MPFLILFVLRFKAAVLSDVSTNAAAAADVLLNTFHAINHRLVSPAIYQQLLPRLGREMANISGVRPNRYLPPSATCTVVLHKQIYKALNVHLCVLCGHVAFSSKKILRGVNFYQNASQRRKDYIGSSFFTTVIECFPTFCNCVHQKSISF